MTYLDNDPRITFYLKTVEYSEKELKGRFPMTDKELIQDLRHDVAEIAEGLKNLCLSQNAKTEQIKNLLNSVTRISHSYSTSRLDPMHDAPKNQNILIYGRVGETYDWVVGHYLGNTKGDWCVNNTQTYIQYITDCKAWKELPAKPEVE